MCYVQLSKPKVVIDLNHCSQYHIIRINKNTLIFERLSYFAGLQKVTKVTNPISDFTFLSVAKLGKSSIKNPFFDLAKAMACL